MTAGERSNSRRKAVQAPVADIGGASDALLRLHATAATLPEPRLRAWLRSALASLHARSPAEGSEAALRALHLDETSGCAWWVLAVCRESTGALGAALGCYERALDLLPDDPDLPGEAARVAARLNLPDKAEALFTRHLARNPGSAQAAADLAGALRRQSRFEDAVETLRPYLDAEPANPLLWNALGAVVFDQGRVREAATFFDESLRLQPDFPRARHNRANAYLAERRPDLALAELDRALAEAAPAEEAAAMRLARATALLSAGDLAEGWAAYEARFDLRWPHAADIRVGRPRWSPGEPLEGRRLLVVGEQGLGDEILFAHALTDVVAALGDEANLTLAVDSRLAPLLARTHPRATRIDRRSFRIDGRLVTSVEAPGETDLWTPIGSLMRAFRDRAADFPADRASYLAPNPAEVRRWRDVLDAAGPGPRIGLVWKSLGEDADRARYFTRLEQWRPVLSLPGVTLVNLQYGSTEGDLAEVRARFGVDILQPPGLDLTQDLDGVAALACALDLVVGPANAATNLAAACGARSWFVLTPDAWIRLGQAGHPWHAAARVFEAELGRWDRALEDVAEAIRGHFALPA